MVFVEENNKFFMFKKSILYAKCCNIFVVICIGFKNI